METYTQYKKADFSPGFVLYKTANAHNRIVREALAPWKLTQAQFAILAATHYLTAKQQRCTQADVATHLELDKMLVSDVVKLLVTKKLLHKKTSPTDARAFQLGLTKKADEFMPQAFQAVEEADRRFFESSPLVMRST